MKNKTVLITGASGNVGAALVERFLEDGCKVAAIITPGNIPESGMDSPASYYGVDLTDESEAAEVVRLVNRQHGPVEFAVLTAGGFAMGNIADTSGDILEKMYSLNFLTAWNVARPVVQIMKESGTGGKLVFFGARPALYPEEATGMAAYSLSKSLIFRLAELINTDDLDHGISASVVVPGIIDTPQNRQAMPGADFSAWIRPSWIAERIFGIYSGPGTGARDNIIEM